MTVSERLRRLLVRRNTTQSEVAEAAGMSRQQVGQIASGAVPNPGILTVERIVEAAGGTMIELYAEDEGGGQGGAADRGQDQRGSPHFARPL
jgi:transcriptional regulator with XRE-family HTH domain